MHPALLVFAIISMIVTGVLLFLVLFERGLEYKFTPVNLALASREFRQFLGALCDAAVHGLTDLQVLTNGDVFYKAELEAIRNASDTINLERYIFQRGEIGRLYVEALAERARAGVKVKVVLDAIGSFTAWDETFRPLREAGGRVQWYQPIRWDTLKRFNNRTHRDLLVVDGRVGFVGGAGIADWWLKDSPKEPRWRDTMCRVEGEVLIGLQTTFAENWLESSGEILSGDDDYFPAVRGGGGTGTGDGAASGLVVVSSPSAGKATRARVLFQTLLASATRAIDITTPYFLPDHSAMREMARAIRERGVRVRILVPGRHSDHLLTRRAGRRRYGVLLQAGAEIYEYEPAMIHAKVMVVDGLWSVVGSTNFDNRSFGINDEVNLAVCGETIAGRLARDFEADLARSHRVSYEEWAARPWHERVVEFASRILERQS